MTDSSSLPLRRETFRAVFFHGRTLMLAIAFVTADAFSQEKAATERPAIARPDPAVAPKSDRKPNVDPTGADEKSSQFAKNESPSGVALGVLEKEVDNQGLPEALEGLAKQGALASAEQDWPRAREAYLKMIDAAPQNALAFANLGIVEYRMEDYEAARSALRRSLQLNPTISQNWITLGLVYHREGNYELAIASLARALHEDSRDPRAHLYMAVVINDYGWGAAAVTELQRAIQLDPNYADAHFNLALMYLEQKPPAIELARRHYYVAIDLGAAPDKELERQVAVKKPTEETSETKTSGESTKSSE
ncbi:MAG: tetratricopeptide repeat protein [Verrucomicrobiae bacterium]|nr:tetratricopeptide repeat protein [Verrucomicrobiae bacterium]